MSTARSRIHPARRVPQPRLEQALGLGLGLVVLVARRAQQGVVAEEAEEAPAADGRAGDDCEPGLAAHSRRCCSPLRASFPLLSSPPRIPWAAHKALLLLILRSFRFSHPRLATTS